MYNNSKKITNKEAKNILNNKPVIWVDDSSINAYTNGTNYYNSGVYGWNYDVYEIGNVIICAGYRPVGFDGYIKKTVTLSDRENKATDQVIRDLLASSEVKK